MKKTFTLILMMFSFFVHGQTKTWKEMQGMMGMQPNGDIYSIYSDRSGNIYAAGTFTNGVDGSVQHRYVSKWNGTSWHELDGYDSLKANHWIFCITGDTFGNIYAAGQFSGAMGNKYVAKYNDTSWSELGGVGGINSSGTVWYINSICTDGFGNVYAAGHFQNASNKEYVAKWDGISWTELGGANSLAANGYIFSICSDASGNIYASGNFTNGATNAVGKRYVAKFNGTNWSELGGFNSLSANGEIIVVSADVSGNIYCGGDFTNGATKLLGSHYIAKYNGTSWSELGGLNGLSANAVIYSLTINGSNIYCGGDFKNSNLNRYIAEYNGTSWGELGGNNSLAANGNIRSIVHDTSGNVFAVGSFHNAENYLYVAKYNGSSWAELKGVQNFKGTNFIRSICSDNLGNTYFGGAQTNGFYNNFVTKHDGLNWSELGGANSFAANNWIYKLCSDTANNIYAAGDFTNGATYNVGKRYVAKYNGVSWAELGGINALAADSSINCVISDKAGNIYASGNFRNSNGKMYVAKFNGASWSEVGGVNGISANSGIYTLFIDHLGNIYAAGNFTNTSGKYYVAMYNGVSWAEVGGLNGLSANSNINSICGDTIGNIYAAGNFSLPTNTNIKYVAKWNGSNWSPVGGANSWTSFGTQSFSNLNIDSIGNLYASGSLYGFNNSLNVMRWNGSFWSNLGGNSSMLGSPGVNGFGMSVIAACSPSNNKLIVCGTFINNDGYYMVESFKCHTTYSVISGSICNGSPYFFNNMNLSLVGTYYDTISNSIGCDSIITLNLINNNPSSSSITQTICSNQAYTFNNQILNNSGIYMDTIPNYSGCDSIITLNLIVNSVSYNFINQSICSNQTYNFNNQNLNITGNYYDTLINYLGCDSILILNLTVNPISTSSSTQIICGTGGYLFNGQTLNATGVYYDTLTNYVGCDSIITLNLFINYPTSSTINAFICSGGSAYQFNNTSFSIPGTYYDTLINAHNCDSIITLQLSMHLPSAYSFTHSTCPNQPYNFNGKILNTTGVYYDTIPNYVGCDSIITLTLNVNTISNSVLNDTICSNNFYTFNNHNLNIAGTYYDTLSNYLGCDSIIALHLIVKQSSTLTLTQIICAGTGGYTFNGINRTITGVYYDTLSNANGCDSLITLNLFVNNPSSSSINGAICNGNNYNFNGTQLSLSGIYNDTIPNHLGCDSIITLNLSVGNPSVYSFNQIICSNQNYNFNGKICTSTGIYLDTIPNYQFCDSIITLHLTILPSSSSILSNSICIGTTYLFNNQNLSIAGTYYDTLINYLGCDSLITLHLSLKPTSSSITNASICPTTSYLFNGNNYSLAGSYLVHLTNYLGCDSAATLLLTIKPTSTSITNASVCVGQSYTFNGNTYNTAGSYVVHLTNYLGCDSAATLILKMNSSSSSVTNATICAGQSYTFNGNTYNSVGNYVVHLSNYVGCDSAATLNLTLSVLPTPTISVSALTTTTICMGDVVHFKFITTNAGASPIYNVLVNGISIGQTLVDTVNIPGLINGSIVTIELTNYPSCNSSLPILSNAISITVINTYIPTISISANPSGVINAGTNVIFTATPTNGGSSPQYNFKLNDSSVQSSSSATYANSSLNNGDVISCELTANNICQTTPTSTSNIILISVNATGINIEKNSDEGLNVIPNPCATCEVIVTASMQVNQLDVTNILGKSVSVQFEKTTKGYLINMPNQSAGVYFIRNIKTGQVIKFVKE